MPDDIQFGRASTPQSRAIDGLRNRATKYGDDYLNEVAAEFERTYELMRQARGALQIIAKTAEAGLDTKNRISE